MNDQQSSAPTVDVIFENAVISDKSEWEWVRRELDPSLATSSYDRAPTKLTTALTQRVDLAARISTLSKDIGAFEPGRKHILVGHSIGGLLVQAYAAAHPDNVAGIVLIDPTHPDQNDRSTVQLTSYLWLNQRLLLRFLRSLFRRKLREAEQASLNTLPPEYVPSAAAKLSMPATWITAYRESREVTNSWQSGARRLRHLNVPTVILISGEAIVQDPSYADLLTELAQFSPSSRIEIVEQATHESIVMNEAHASGVANAISWVRNQISERNDNNA